MKRKILEKLKFGGLSKNMAISGICKPISIVISYVYVPIVLEYLGVEKYGVWATILTILSWISYFDIGIGNGLRNKLTESIASKDKIRGKKLVSSAYAFISIIMIIVTLIFCVVAVFLDWNRIFGVQNFSENLTAVVCISVIFVAISFVLAICKNVLYAIQKAAYVSCMEIMIQLLNVVGVLIAKHFMSGNLFMMATIYGFSMLITYIVFSIVLYSREKALRPDVRTINLSEGKALTSLGLQFFIVQICALILFTTDSLIISYLYGAADVTPYSTVNKLFSAVSSIYIALLAPIWSITTKYKSEHRWKELNGIIKKLMILMVPFFLATLLLGCIFKPISAVWLGQQLNYGDWLIPMGTLYCMLFMWTNTFGQLTNGLELMLPNIVISILQAVINIPLSYFFAYNCSMGSAGVLLGTNISLSISCIALPCIIYKNLKGRSYENSNCNQ